MKRFYKFFALSLLTLGGYNANAQISYSEDFESSMGVWSGTYSTTTTDPCEANTSVRDNIYTSAGGNLTSSSIGTSNGGLITLDFMYKVIDWSGGGATPVTFGTTEVQYSASASGPWTTAYTIDASNHSPSTSCASVNVTFTPLPGDMYMRFYTNYGTGDYYFYIDDIVMSQGPAPSCPQPTALTASNITSSGADIAWTTGGSTNWNIEYGPAGFTPGTGTMVMNITNPYSLSMLTSNSGYDVYVQDSCGAGDVSNWSMVSLTTLPNMHPFPLMEDFEDSVLFFENDASSNTDWVLTNALAHSGSQSAYNDYGSNADNILHETGILDLSGTGAPVLEFWHIAELEGCCDEAFVEISTDGGATYSVLPSSAYRGMGGYSGYFNEDSYSEWDNTDDVDNSHWKKEQFSLAGYTVSDVRFRFRLESDGSVQDEGWYIDDVHIYEPTCPNPFNMTEVYANMDTVVFNWNAGYQETMWNIEYGELGFAQGSGTMIAAGDTIDTIANLNLGAIYEFYLQADCGGGDEGDWIGPYVYATPILNDATCDAILVTPNTDFSARVFSNIGATLQTDESGLPGTQYNTAWFKTVVPNSGHLVIGTCGSDFTSVVGAYAYDTLICDSMETFGQVAYASAYTSSSYSVCGSYGNGSVEICGATPGDTILFYVGGSSSSQSGIINLIVSDYSMEGYAGEGPQEPVSACAGDTIDLWSQLSNQLTNAGDWEYPSNSAVIVNDTTANTGAMTLVGNEIYYIVSNSCDADTATVAVNAATASNSGEAMANFQACSNGDVFLYDGLTGTIDAGGTWGDDTNTGLLNGSKFIADGLPDGPYQFTYTVDNGVCPAASTQVTVNLVDCTNISEEEATTFGVYPNPNNGTFFIANGKNESNITLEVIDVQGKRVYSNTYVMGAGAQQEVSLGNVEAGVYLIRVITNNQVFNTNVIVK